MKQTQTIQVYFPVELIKQLHKAVPHGKRSRFIAEAIMEALDRKRALKNKPIPASWFPST